MKDLILIGPQGSGKGTQSRILAKKFNFEIFETGAELRKIAAQKDSPLGQKVLEITSRGDLVPNEIVMELVKNFLQELENPAQTPIIFDGIPRSEVQMQTLESLLESQNREFVALEIHIPEKISFERLSERARIEGRVDDTPEVIERRLANYRKFTEPLLDLFRAKNKLISVDGQGEVEAIESKICQKIGG